MSQGRRERQGERSIWLNKRHRRRKLTTMGPPSVLPELATGETAMYGRRRGTLDECAHWCGRGIRHAQSGNGRADSAGGTAGEHARSTDTGIRDCCDAQGHHARDGQTRGELHRSRHEMEEWQMRDMQGSHGEQAPQARISVARSGLQRPPIWGWATRRPSTRSLQAWAFAPEQWARSSR